MSSPDGCRSSIIGAPICWRTLRRCGLAWNTSAMKATVSGSRSAGDGRAGGSGADKSASSTRPMSSIRRCYTCRKRIPPISAPRPFPRLREYLDGFENLFLVGRNGMHKYNNQDHSMLTAMTAVDNIAAGRTGKSTSGPSTRKRHTTKITRQRNPWVTDTVDWCQEARLA